MSHSRSEENPFRLRVTSPSEWEAIARLTADFHDAVVREAAFLGDEYVDTDLHLKLTADFGGRLRLLVHLQREDVPAVELRFKGVRSVCFDAAELADPARCTQIEGGLLLFEIAAFTARASACDVLVRGPSAIGESVRLADLS